VALFWRKTTTFSVIFCFSKAYLVLFTCFGGHIHFYLPIKFELRISQGDGFDLLQQLPQNLKIRISFSQGNFTML
jgi:hypothetical protein